MIKLQMPLLPPALPLLLLLVKPTLPLLQILLQDAIDPTMEAVMAAGTTPETSWSA
jgi:hypothetical protein